ncbi:MAG: histone deacetylase [Roseiflexaceae bacterium]|nr:histone deacetylase [Roseiflexaceae bacterium]
MKAFYSDTFVLPLPEGHRFPMEKYAMLRERVVAQGIITPSNLVIPPAASDTQLLRAHTADYVARMERGALSSQEIRRIGFPWTPAMPQRSRRSSGATIEACLAALRDGYAVNLAGGTHHACSGHGEGFCIFNDSAVAARELQARGLARRVLVIDCDVHQGNGTAEITRGDDTIFSFSIHGEKNFPFRKEQSDLDIGLEDGAGDERYLAALEAGLMEAIELSHADLALYLAGADPFYDDKLGRLALTKPGLAARDRLVFDFCEQAGLPVAISMAGGYARIIADTVDIQIATIAEAARRAS